MQGFPHHYRATASADAEGHVGLSSGDMPQLVSAPPAEFGGPGDQWSPEHLLVASVADCFVLTFRAIARASKVDWIALEVDTEGLLDRVEKVTQFTGFKLKASLTVAADTDHARVTRLLQKAEAACLITNSLKAPCHLETAIIAAP